MRAGAYALSLLAVPLNCEVLSGLEDGPKALVDLRRSAGSPPQTTMRVHLRTLTELGIVERHRRPQFPGSVDLTLGPSGQDLLAVAAVLREWLANAPGGPIALGSAAAKSSIKALVDGWSSTIIRALAARPLTLTELNRLIADVNYPSLERRLSAMRLTGQIERRPETGRGTPYKVTSWLRQATASLAAAARWERSHARALATPIGRLDIEAAFLLAVPALRLPGELSGICRLAVDVQSGGEHRLAGVMTDIREGEVASCVSRLQGDADGWALGSAAAWLRAVIEGEPDQLELGGDCQLALGIVEALHSALQMSRRQA